ncbi:MAG: hypothetical protein E7277_00960 [Lachnospiraceae bacterium]|jgi:uncharacterized Zn finger protein (UPF0148 family)|nr:hypothetical protein [Lachnospiraceae bacterium]
MKCKKCGSEVVTGKVYCTNCGAEIQIVPDYNALDDDISNGLRPEEPKQIRSGNEKDTTQKMQQPQQPMKNKQPWDKKKKALFIVLGIVCVVAIVFGVSVFVTNRKHEQSFAFQKEMAQEYYDNHLYEKALSSIDKAIKLEPKDMDSRILRADILKELGLRDEMINTLLTVTDKDSDNYEAYKRLVNAYGEKQDYASMQKLMKNITDEKILALFVGYVPSTPKFKVEPGNYDTRVMLEITSDSTSQIYYTIDGKSPVANGIAYTQEIKLEEGTTTVKAVATNEYGIYSDVVEGEYVIKLAVPDKPEVSLPSGTYTEAKKVEITVPNGCTAYYTWDGSTPNEQAIRYKRPFEIPSGNNVLSVIVVNENRQASDVARFNYIYYPQDEDEETQEE